MMSSLLYCKFFIFFLICHHLLTLMLTHIGVRRHERLNLVKPHYLTKASSRSSVIHQFLITAGFPAIIVPCRSGSVLMGSPASVDVLKACPRGCFGSQRVTSPHLSHNGVRSCWFSSLRLWSVWVCVCVNQSKQTGQVSLRNPASCALIGSRADWPSLWLAVGSVWVGGASKVWNRKWRNICAMRRESVCGVFLCHSDFGR